MNNWKEFAFCLLCGASISIFYMAIVTHNYSVALGGLLGIALSGLALVRETMKTPPSED